MSSKETRDKFTSRRKMKSVKEELFRWICKQQATNSFLDRYLLREKALELTKMRAVNGFKCSDHWMNTFLREHGFSTDLSNRTGPMFDNYREWIDLMRSMIIKYKHNDLFHVDELTMYSDICPTKMTVDEIDSEEGSCSLGNRITVLIGCNSSGTTKLPLLICGPYPSRITTKDHVYCHNEDSLIDDDLFKNWLRSVNDRMSRCSRKILLFLQRNRAHALRDFPLSNVNLVYLPEDFPPHLRPLRRDVFHYVKMIFRRRYAEKSGQYAVEWNLPDILESLIDAWETIPREIIICRFQRTHFRTDDYFLQIDCDCWEDLKTGVAFKRFVTFDDDLTDKKASFVTNNHYHDYNLRPNSGDKIQVHENDIKFASDSEEEIAESKCQEPLRKIDQNYQAMFSDLINRVNRTLEPVGATKNDTTRENKSRLKKNLTGGHSDHRMTQKRPYSETQFSSKEETGDRHESIGRIIQNVCYSKDSDAGCSQSIGREQFKRQTLQRHRSETNHATKSLQTVIDKALSLTTSTKAGYAKELIDSIYASKQETKRDVNCQTEFGNLNEEENMEVSFNLIATVPLESNQPSTSANDWDNLSEEVPQNIFQETVKSHPSKETCSNKLLELSPENRTSPDQNSDGLPSNQQENSRFSRKTRRKSELNGSGDDSNGSEPSEKKLKIDCNWSEQFETTFVFGSSNASEHANCSSQHQHDENIIDSCILTTIPSISPKE